MWTQSVALLVGLEHPRLASRLISSRDATWNHCRSSSHWETDSDSGEQQWPRRCLSCLGHAGPHRGYIVKENVPLPYGETISQMLLTRARVWVWESVDWWGNHFLIFLYWDINCSSSLHVCLRNVMRDGLSIFRPWDPSRCKNKSLNSLSRWMVFTWDQEKHLRNHHAELAEHSSEEVAQKWKTRVWSGLHGWR